MNRQCIAQINSLNSNSVYLESKEGIELLNNKIKDISEHFKNTIDEVMDPGRTERKLKAMREDPLIAAGIRGFDRLKWQLEEGIDVFGVSDG